MIDAFILFLVKYMDLILILIIYVIN